MLMRYKDSPEPRPPGMLRRALKTKSCTPPSASAEARSWRPTAASEGSSFEGFSLSLAVPTEAEADRAFAALAEGGQVHMPLGQDVLVAALRHAHRPLRHRLDGERRAEQ